MLCWLRYVTVTGPGPNDGCIGTGAVGCTTWTFEVLAAAVVPDSPDSGAFDILSAFCAFDIMKIQEGKLQPKWITGGMHSTKNDLLEGEPQHNNTLSVKQQFFLSSLIAAAMLS